MITVFTPTFNRAKLLPRLYDSLKFQTDKDFEWIVVDDGSTDGTDVLFDDWIQEPEFDVRYIRQENGGKHRAVNKGVSLAKGEMFFIVDSDDYLRNDAIEKIKYYESTIHNSSVKMSGVCGQRVYPDGSLVGTSFDGEYMDSFTYDNKRNSISGDKSEVFYTSVLKEFPFPEIEGEKFCPEALVWNRISYAGYKMRYFNEGIYFCDYQPDGLTSKIDRLLIDNINGYLLYAKEVVNNQGSSIAEKWSCIANSARRARIRNISFRSLAKEFQTSKASLAIGYLVALIVYSRRTA